MPVKVFKRGTKFCVMEAASGGKGASGKGRCHPTKDKAAAQARAINASLRKSGKIDS